MCKIINIDDHLEDIKDDRFSFSLIEDLNKFELRKLSLEVFNNIRTSGEDIYSAYISVLARNKIMCPHPQHMKKYKRLTTAYGLQRKEFFCNLCKSDSFEGEISIPKPQEVQDIEA